MSLRLESAGRSPRVEDLLTPAPPRAPRGLLRLRNIALLLCAIGFVVFVPAYGTGYDYGAVRPARPVPVEGLPENDADLKKFVTRENRRARQIGAELAKLAPQGAYIVVDQTQNRLYLKKDGQTILEATCSAGSGYVLQENPNSKKNRQWVFDTPRGLYHVKKRVEKPVWNKPVWAFVEEGRKVPANPEDRVEYGTLGEYALHLGDGYMIHGTLYERLLGRSVTHGCIRLGRDDLRRVWAETRIGTPVYIY
jgi:L,D-transpeptidase YbiS